MSELSTFAAGSCGALAVLAAAWASLCRVPRGRLLGAGAAGLGALVPGALLALEALATPAPFGLLLVGWLGSLALTLATLSWASREWSGSQAAPLLFGALVIGCDVALALAFLWSATVSPGGV